LRTKLVETIVHVNGPELRYDNVLSEELRQLVLATGGIRVKRLDATYVIQVLEFLGRFVYQLQ
jgi:hypothetical protein